MTPLIGSFEKVTLGECDSRVLAWMQDQMQREQLKGSSNDPGGLCM